MKTAPTPFASDVALQTTNSNAMMDAMASRNATNIKATAAVLCTPAQLAASKRMTEYCGTTVSP